MHDVLDQRLDFAAVQQVADHLAACDAHFVPPLTGRVDIRAYAAKIVERARRFEAWSGDTLVGLVACYIDQIAARAFVTNVSVLPAWGGRGVASTLLRRCIASARDAGMDEIVLQVDPLNAAAIALYERIGFHPATPPAPEGAMTLPLKIQDMSTPRNYDTEIRDARDHKYAYGFDFDVMHPFMVRAFEPLFRPGKVLELGSFKGDFTRRLQSCFTDITCVEASGEALAQAQNRLEPGVRLVHGTFEQVKLPEQYDNIVMTHVLEHLDDPVAVLRRINDEWLADGGRFFVACPNANAPSRQIAVLMGLISHNSAVTPAEREHGHRITYSLDTLERDAVAAGLRVVHRSGIFFKALANFQWDRLLQTDIVTPEYLEGCYQLGQRYPDLCSSIFLVCEKGERK